MKQFGTFLTLVSVVAIFTCGAQNLSAQDPQQTQIPVTRITQPDQGGVYPSITHNGDITEFLKLLSHDAQKNIIPSPSVRGLISVSLFDVNFKEALDAVLPVNGFAYEEKDSFIYVYTKKELDELKAADRHMETRMFRLNYIPAEDVQTMIAPLLSSGAIVTTSPDALSSDSAGEAWAGGKYLIVRDYPEPLEEVAALIKEVDRKPPQVMIEATILVARLTDSNKLGINFNVLAGVDFQSAQGVVSRPSQGYNTVSAQGTSTGGTGGTGGTGSTTGVAVSGTAVGAVFGGGGLNIGIVNSNIGLFVDALESITDVATLGNPKVLTLNRQQGELIVGDEFGYISSSEATQVSTTSTVTFLKTGVQLRFRPFVMDDGYIRMELNPEDSDGGLDSDGLPFKNTTEVNTNIIVKDGRTIVIGGLFRDKVTLGRSQIPLLGDIPILGHLFRTSTDENRKEEVIFLITPHVVKEEVDYAAGAEALARTDRVMLGVRDGLLGTGRERLSAAHYHQARQLQAAGKLNDALWNARMAAHLTPTFVDAYELRNELLGEQIYQGEYGSMRLFMRQLVEKDK